MICLMLLAYIISMLTLWHWTVVICPQTPRLHWACVLRSQARTDTKVSDVYRYMVTKNRSEVSVQGSLSIGVTNWYMCRCICTYTHMYMCVCMKGTSEISLNCVFGKVKGRQNLWFQIPKGLCAGESAERNLESDRSGGRKILSLSADRLSAK